MTSALRTLIPAIALFGLAAAFCWPYRQLQPVYHLEYAGRSIYADQRLPRRDEVCQLVRTHRRLYRREATVTFTIRNVYDSRTGRVVFASDVSAETPMLMQRLLIRHQLKGRMDNTASCTL